MKLTKRQQEVLDILRAGGSVEVIGGMHTILKNLVEKGVLTASYIQRNVEELGDKIIVRASLRTTLLEEDKQELEEEKAESTYQSVANSSFRAAHKESNDCAVIAVTAATGQSYAMVHRRMQELGRKDRHGTRWSVIVAALKSFGFELEEYSVRRFIDERYPEGHKILRSVTTHHPQRFPGVFREGETWMMLTQGGRHISTIKDGELADWSEGRSLQCRGTMHKVVPVLD